jgi:mRNA interferase RelE/StbE
MKIEILDKAIKDLKKIDKIQAKKILNSISNLEHYPNIANIKKLTNYNPTHRLRVGNYRVLFDIENDIIIVSRIKHRKDVY